MMTCTVCAFEGIADEEVTRIDCNGDEVYGEQYDHGTPLCNECKERIYYK